MAKDEVTPPRRMSDEELGTKYRDLFQVLRHALNPDRQSDLFELDRIVGERMVRAQRDVLDHLVIGYNDGGGIVANMEWRESAPTDFDAAREHDRDREAFRRLLNECGPWGGRPESERSEFTKSLEVIGLAVDDNGRVW